MAHGPLRVIVTVNEEDGMDGAFGMSAFWLDDADYLIKIDNEVSTQVLVSTAAGDTIHMKKDLEFIDPMGDTTLAIELTGLKGGHSGVEINKGRLNGVIGLGTAITVVRSSLSQRETEIVDSQVELAKEAGYEMTSYLSPCQLIRWGRRAAASPCTQMDCPSICLGQ